MTGEQAGHPPVFHGELRPRGLQQPPPRTVSYEGRFGRLFRDLAPAVFDDSDLHALAETMRDRGVPTWDPSASRLEGDNEHLPAGYTYLGQFIDHDLTFDPSSAVTQEEDPFGLLNFRTPRYDLDSLYGSGPIVHPFLYEKRSDPPRLLLEPNAAGQPDVPRNFHQSALTGDPRNDENKIVSQLQVLFAQLHNRFLDEVGADASVSAEQRWVEARRRLRWHYQWIIVHDFLRKLIGDELLGSLYVVDGNKADIRLRSYRARVHAYMPVEFSGAAFRFGHSMLRPTYLVNDRIGSHPLFVSGNPGPTDDLTGGSRLPVDWDVEWKHFFEMGERVPQPSRLINTLISEPVFDLPHQQGSLPFRNMKTGVRLELPSGQDVARELGIEVLSTAELNGTPDPTPLWFYVLKEAEQRAEGLMLGPTGARIVAETLLGMLVTDRNSFISTNPEWQPSVPQVGEHLEMADLIRFAAS